jgi:hypothetical protein
VPREAFAVNETFTDIPLNDDTHHVDVGVEERHDAMKNVTNPLFQRMSSQAGFLSLQQSAGKRSVSCCGSSWEANKDLDEQVQILSTF